MGFLFLWKPLIISLCPLVLRNWTVMQLHFRLGLPTLLNNLKTQVFLQLWGRFSHYFFVKWLSSIPCFSSALGVWPWHSFGHFGSMAEVSSLGHNPGQCWCCLVPSSVGKGFPISASPANAALQQLFWGTSPHPQDLQPPLPEASLKCFRSKHSSSCLFPLSTSQSFLHIVDSLSFLFLFPVS